MVQYLVVGGRVEYFTIFTVDLDKDQKVEQKRATLLYHCKIYNYSV